MGSETNIPTLMFRNPIFDGEREEYRYVDYSLWLYIQQPDTTTSGWQRRRKTGDQVRLPLPWCLERNTHNHERRRKTGDRGPGTSTPALMFRPKRPTITDEKTHNHRRVRSCSRGGGWWCKEPVCRNERCHLPTMKEHQGNMPPAEDESPRKQSNSHHRTYDHVM